MDRDGNVLTPLDAAEVRAAAQRLVADGIEAIAVCFLHAYRNPAHEQRGGGDRARGIPRHRRVDLVRRGGGAVGIPALQHHLRQRLRAAADGPLHRAGWSANCARAASAASCASCTPPAACCRRRPRAPSRSACWRAGPAGGGLATAFFGAAAGKRRRDLVRHGRHHREGLPDRGRPRRDRADDGGGARAPLQEGLRPADQGAGHRHDRDRRRRRLDRRDRRGRPAARRPAFRRRRSGPGLLRARRHRADRDRRQPAARLLRSRLLPRRPHGARSRRRRTRAGQASARSSASARSTPPGASTAWWWRTWPPPRASISSRRARTRAPTPWSASAAPGRRMPPRSRACSACSRC